MRIDVNKHWPVYLDFGRAGSLSLQLYWTYHRLLHMRIAVKNHALPVYKKNRIASLLCIFENTIMKKCKDKHFIQLNLFNWSITISWHVLSSIQRSSQQWNYKTSSKNFSACKENVNNLSSPEFLEKIQLWWHFLLTHKAPPIICSRQQSLRHLF